MYRWVKIILNNKQISVLFTLNGDSYNMLVRSNKKLTSNEFKKIRKYLEDEGYIA